MTPQGSQTLTADAALEEAFKAYTLATGYYIAYHKGLSSVSADRMRAGVRAAIDAYCAALSILDLEAKLSKAPPPSPPVSGEAVTVDAAWEAHALLCWINPNYLPNGALNTLSRFISQFEASASPLTSEPVGVTRIETAHLEWLVNEFSKGHFTGRKTAVKHALDFLSAAIGEPRRAALEGEI